MTLSIYFGWIPWEEVTVASLHWQQRELRAPSSDSDIHTGKMFTVRTICVTVPPLTILWTSFSFPLPCARRTIQHRGCFLWVGGLSPAYTRENKQNHSQVRRSISRVYKHAPLSFQLFISRQLPCCYWQLGECWDTAGITSWHLLSPCFILLLCWWHRNSFTVQGWQRMLN